MLRLVIISERGSGESGTKTRTGAPSRYKKKNHKQSERILQAGGPGIEVVSPQHAAALGAHPAHALVVAGAHHPLTLQGEDHIWHAVLVGWKTDTHTRRHTHLASHWINFRHDVIDCVGLTVPLIQEGYQLELIGLFPLCWSQLLRVALIQAWEMWPHRPTLRTPTPYNPLPTGSVVHLEDQLQHADQWKRLLSNKIFFFMGPIIYTSLDLFTFIPSRSTVL